MQATRDDECALDPACYKISYGAMHQRIKRTLGPAKGRQCANCPNAADQWAYDREDPHVRYDVQTGFPFSLDVDHYVPMCHSCHRRFDINRPVAERYVHPKPPPAERIRALSETELSGRVNARRADMLQAIRRIA